MKKCSRCGKDSDILIKLECYDHGKNVGNTMLLCSVCHFEHCLNHVRGALDSGGAEVVVVDKDDL